MRNWTMIYYVIRAREINPSGQVKSFYWWITLTIFVSSYVFMHLITLTLFLRVFYSLVFLSLKTPFHMRLLKLMFPFWQSVS